MKKIMLEEKKRILVDILSEIDSFCRNNNIQYFLIGGSLIGAVRHNGFIPWDDDIDIGMSREDYERFVKEYASDSNFTQVLDFRNCKNYIWPAAKVIHKGTLLYENNYKKVDLGVNVDVFAWDGVPGDIEKARRHYRKINRYRDVLTLKHLVLNRKRSVIKNAIVILGKVFCIVPDKWLLSRIHKLSIKFAGVKTDFVCNFAGAWKEKEIVKRSLLGSVVPHQFENAEYPIPVGYDEFLRGIYGDYMQLPPKEKQVTHHGSESYWKNR